MTEGYPRIGVGVVILRAGMAANVPTENAPTANAATIREPDVLLIRRGTPPRQGEWSLPGGRQHWGETVRETARREVREETGLEIEILGLIDVVDALIPAPEPDDPGALAYHYTLIDFAARAVGGTPRAGDDAIEAVWLPLDDAIARVAWEETARVLTSAARGFAHRL